MNVQNKSSRYLIICLLWTLSLFSSATFGVTEQIRVSSNNDDAEELIIDGDMYRDSTDLEFGYDDFAGGLQIVGMRFKNVDIPQGATINSAYIEFVTDETDSGTTNLVIFGEDHDSPNLFANNDNNISNRTKTSASVNWIPSTWGSVNQLHQTPDIRVIIQEIVDRIGWAANNNLVLIIEPGSGCTTISCQRTAESHDGESGSAPLLVIDYTVESSKLSVSSKNVIQEYDVSSYGGSGQDKTGTVEIRDTGLSLYLEGNRWQKINLPYTVTADTVIEFDFQSTVQGEILGLGFDNDLSISPDKSFKIYGTQNWGISDFDTYSGSGITHFTIPVGQFYTGNFQYLFFINDDDSNPTGNSLYSNIVVYEKTKLLAEYRFEETIWDGSPNEILDSTGNGHHAKALRDSILVNPPPAAAPAALSGDPGTCGYASQSSGSIQVTGLPLDTSTIGVKTTVTFWMNWNGIENVMPIGWNVHDIWLVSGSMGFNTGGGDIYGISSAGLANSWHHVAIEFTNGSVTSNRMHIDGVEQVLTQRRRSPNNRRAFVNSEFRIGGWSINTSYDFQGLMDEVRIYQDALSTTQVNTIMNEVHPCNIPAINHYQIIHDGDGLTCAPEDVLIRACSDANCNSFDNTIDTTLTMQINGGSDQNITIVNGSSVNETFVYTDPDNPAVLSLTSDYSCSDTSDNSTGCGVNFAKAGFLLNLDNHQSCTTPNLTIKAVKLSDSGLDCAPAYTGNQSVDFIFNYSNPSNGTEVPSLATVDMAAATVTQTRTITFDRTGTANLSFNYQDAGQVRINVSDAAAAGLTASSVTAVVSPAKLIVASPDTNTDCVSGDATCPVFKAAGAQFNLNITAACSNNTVTKNFEMDNIPLTVTTIAPNVDNPVVLGVTSINVLAADNGIHKISNQTVSEVGVFTITATPPMNGYFGETIPAAVSANIG